MLVIMFEIRLTKIQDCIKNEANCLFIKKRSQKLETKDSQNNSSVKMGGRNPLPMNQLIHLNSRIIISLIVLIMISSEQHFSNYESNERPEIQPRSQGQIKNVIGLIMLADGHIVITKDDRGSSLVLTGEDGRGGKGGKGKGKGGDGDQLVITGETGGGRNTNMVMQDAGNREGDVVIQGNSMIVPGEDGHIVLADGRSQGNERQQPPPPNLFAFWLPYMNSRMGYGLAPFFGGQFG